MTVKAVRSVVYSAKWDSCNRPNYFLKRLTDTHTRFERIIGALPARLQDRDGRDRIREKLKYIAMSPIIVVLDDQNDLDLSTYIDTDNTYCTRHSDHFASQESPSNVLMIIHRMQFSDHPDEMRQKIKSHIREENEVLKASDEKIPHTSLYIYDIKGEASEEISDNLQSLTNEVVSDMGEENCGTPRVVIGVDDAKIKADIVFALENAVMDVFESMYHLVDDFTGPVRGEHSDMNILESQEFLQQIEQTIFDRETVVDCLNDNNSEDNNSGEDSSNGTDVKFGPARESMTKRLSAVVTESLSSPLSIKYDIQQSICQTFLKIIDFEAEVDKAQGLTEVLRCCHSSLSEDDSEIQTSSLSERFPLVQKYLVSAMEPIVVTAEEKTARLAHVVNIMRRLKFELQGYFTQSVSRRHLRHVSQKMDDQFKEHIRKIDGVTGVGFIFGTLEIHVKSKTQELLASIADAATASTMVLPYKVKELRFNKWY